MEIRHHLVRGLGEQERRVVRVAVARQVFAHRVVPMHDLVLKGEEGDARNRGRGTVGDGKIGREDGPPWEER